MTVPLVHAAAAPQAHFRGSSDPVQSGQQRVVHPSSTTVELHPGAAADAAAAMS